MSLYVSNQRAMLRPSARRPRGVLAAVGDPPACGTDRAGQDRGRDLADVDVDHGVLSPTPDQHTVD